MGERQAKGNVSVCKNFDEYMAGERSESIDAYTAEGLQTDASLGAFGELLRQVAEDSPTFTADCSSDEAPFSTTSLYSQLTPGFPRDSPTLADTEQLAQHAEREAARFQLTERERRERNKAAQAAYRQRKRVSHQTHRSEALERSLAISPPITVQAKVATDKQDLQQAADRVAVLEQQLSDLRSARTAPLLEV